MNRSKYIIFIIFIFTLIGCNNFNIKNKENIVNKNKIISTKNMNLVLFISSSINEENIKDHNVLSNIYNLQKRSIKFENMIASTKDNISNIFSLLLSQYKRTHKIINNITIKGHEDKFIQDIFKDHHTISLIQWGKPILPKYLSEFNINYNSDDISYKYETIFSSINNCFKRLNKTKPFFLTFIENNSILPMYEKLYLKIFKNKKLAKLNYIDTAFSYLIKKLKENNYSNNTIIVFIGLNCSKNINKIPKILFYMFFPTKKEFIILKNLSIVDIFPTICEYFNIKQPDFIEGISFLDKLNLIKNKNIKRKGIIYETNNNVNFILKDKLFTIKLDSLNSNTEYNKFENNIIKKKEFKFYLIDKFDKLKPITNIILTKELIKEYSFPIYKWLKGYRDD